MLLLLDKCSLWNARLCRWMGYYVRHGRQIKDSNHDQDADDQHDDHQALANVDYYFSGLVLHPIARGLGRGAQRSVGYNAIHLYLPSPTSFIFRRRNPANYGPVPDVQWSPTLAAEAYSWAKYNADLCGLRGKDPNTASGQNQCFMYGYGVSTGPSADQFIAEWVESERGNCEDKLL